MKLRNFYKNLTFENIDSEILKSLKNFTYLTSDDIQLSSNVFYDCTETPISSVILRFSENQVNKINNSICLFKTDNIDLISYDIDIDDGFLLNKDLTSLSFKPNTSYIIEVKDNLIYLNELENFDNYLNQSLTFKALTNNSSISFEVISGTVDISGIKFNKNNTGWQPLNGTIQLDENDTVAFRNTKNVLNHDIDNYAKFITEDEFEVSGNINSMINFSNKLPSFCFYSLFKDCTGLKSFDKFDENLQLSEGCFYRLFYGCTSLEKAPELPFKTLAGKCYRSMFRGCTALTEVPTELPVKELPESCYDGMFQDCTSLEIAPIISVLSVDFASCKEMFKGCTNLKTVQDVLPAQILGDECYREMFLGCSSLTKAPELPAIMLKDRCYYGMLSGCSSLVSTPKLQSESLAKYCYATMFADCTSLNSTPILNSTNLKESCYQQMFQRLYHIIYISNIISN